MRNTNFFRKINFYFQRRFGSDSVIFSSPVIRFFTRILLDPLTWPAYIKTKTIYHFAAKRHDYQRFVILSRPRSGTNMLRSALRKHENILCFGELFAFSSKILWDIPGYPQAWWIQKLNNDNPVEFLERYVFTDRPTTINAAGLTVFHEQLREREREYFWDWLEREKDIKIIHLKRSNLLAAIASFEKARQTNNWIINSGQQVSDDDPVVLSANLCEQWFSETEDYWKEAEERFGKDRLLEVYYEDLTADFDKIIGRIEDFLGINHWAVKPATVKQSIKPLSVRIANYQELKEYFSDTDRASFFS